LHPLYSRFFQKPFERASEKMSRYLLPFCKEQASALYVGYAEILKKQANGMTALFQKTGQAHFNFRMVVI
jgi:hypothetical protein